MSPYFSLILPIYNVAPYLERCVDSILAQDFKDYELILVDDGSNDESPQICDRYAKQHSHIRVIHKANGGLSSARNAGFEIAEGEYIWWIDSDDWIEKGALTELYQASCNDQPDIVKFNYYRVNTERWAVIGGVEPGIYIGIEKIEQLLDKALYSVREYSLSAWGHIYHSGFLKSHDLHFVSERIVGSEDYLFNLCALPQAVTVCVLPVLLYNYELREGSLSNRYKKNLSDQYQELYRLMTAQYQDMGILDQYQRGISFFFVWHMIRGIGILNEYCVAKGHSTAEGRKKVRRLLKSSVFQSALKHFDTKSLTKKQRIILFAMKWKLEPLFFYLYVVKPRYKRQL